MKKLFYLFLMVFSLFSVQAWAQPCGTGQSTVIINVFTDGYGYECSWTLASSGGTSYATGGTGGTYANNTLYRDTVCVPNNSCTRFSIFDSYGDGICCSYGPGYYVVIVDGDTVATGGNYTNSRITDFNCPPGSSCTSPDSINVGGPYTATFDDHWYAFTPDSNGMYDITTCGFNTCNTKIWIYDNCGALIDETNAGTTFYDDNSCGSGSLQAIVSAALAAGTTYYIRIGDSGNNCPGNVVWAIQYDGPIRGCTDPTACNYNVLATVSDTCIYPGHPNCPTGPDLLLREDVLRSSMYVANYNATDACMVTENCIAGLGNRNLIRFTTHIENNGTQDYFVGVSGPGNPQFNNNNCHGHWHYEGYAEYILFDQNNTPIPIGFKSGFCVMDLICQHGGTAQYGCGTQGITAGCGDIYDASLDCQWIDITNVPDGNYTFVARVNWDFSPDALGRYETSYTNNWGQVCFTLSRASGAPQIVINTNCPVYTDCLGVPFGNAVPDCNGVCNGSAVMGDLNVDTITNAPDVQLYVTNILNNSLTATTCNDIHNDGDITIFDAALITRCLNDPTKCDFPAGIVNIFDTAYLSIGAVNFADNYVDIHLRNPDNKVLAYEFTMAGLAIDSVVSLVNYPNAAQWSAANSKVLALSTNDSTINRSLLAQPLCRVYFNSVTGSQICIQSIEGIVSDIYQALIPRIEGPCVAPSGTSAALSNNFEVTVSPNPFSETTRFNFSQIGNTPMTLEILDVTGKTIRSYQNINGTEFLFQRQGLPAGMYFYRLSSDLGIRSGKIIMN